MPTKKKITPEEAVANLKERKHAITKSHATAMVKKFKSQTTKIAKAAKSLEASTDTTITFPSFLSYNKAAITKLLKPKDCIGLRIYPALNDQNEFTLVLVAINEANDNIGGDDEAEAAVESKSGKATKKSAASIVAKPAATGGQVLDEAQASPPYPPPNGGL